MSEIETTNEVEVEAFTDELSDEALDREQEGGKWSSRTLPGRTCEVTAEPERR